MAALISKQTQNDIIRAGSTALAMGFSESLTSYLSQQPGLSTVLNTKLNREIFQIGVGSLILTSAKAGRARSGLKQASIIIGTGMIASGAYSALSGLTSGLLQRLPASNIGPASGLGLYESANGQRSALSGLRGAGLGRSMLKPMV